MMPVSERLLAAGRETGNLMLPSSIGLPLSVGSPMKAVTMWHNETGADLEARHPSSGDSLHAAEPDASTGAGAALHLRRRRQDWSPQHLRHSAGPFGTEP